MLRAGAGARRARIDREVLDEAFADLPPPVLIERIRKAISLPAEGLPTIRNRPKLTPTPIAPAQAGPGAQAERGWRAEPEILFDAAPQPPLQRFGPS